MYNFFKKSIPLFIVILKICTGNYTIKDLAVICGLLSDTIIPAAPPQCTAFGLLASIFDQMTALNSIRGCLPLMIIVDNIDFPNMQDTLANNNFDPIFSKFNDTEFDFLVFDNTFTFIPTDTISVTGYSQEIGNLLDQAKAYFPGKLIGLGLNHDIKSMEASIDLTILNGHSDFYVLDSLEYRECKYQNHQADMPLLTSKDDILASLTDLKNATIPLNKVIYVIQMVVYGMLSSDERKPMNNSYARLRISEGAAGIYVNGFEYDDVMGTCRCTTSNDKDPTYRGLKTLAGASQENINNLSFYDCVTGGYPIIN